MRHQSRSLAVLCLGIASGFGAAFHAPSCYSQGNSAVDASQVAFTTPNLVTNGDFDLGTSYWTTTGAGLKWRVEKEKAIFNLSPIPGAPASQLSLSQSTQKPVRRGKTLAVRFQTQGRGHINVVIYETMGDKRTLIARRLNVTKASEPETFTLAVKTPSSYYAGQLAIKFHLGFEPTTLALSHIRLVDLGDTPFDGLSLTPDETKLPDLLPVRATEPVKPAIEAPKIAAQPVEVKTNAVYAPQEPLDLTNGINLIRNGSFAEQDKYWRAFGDDRVHAQLEGKNLKLQLNPIEGEDPSLARFEQEIEKPLKKGEKLTIRFNASGTAKFGVKFQESAAPYESMMIREENAKGTTREYVYQCEAGRDYTANETKIVFLLGYGPGDVTFSDFQVLTPKL